MSHTLWIHQSLKSWSGRSSWVLRLGRNRQQIPYSEWVEKLSNYQRHAVTCTNTKKKIRSRIRRWVPAPILSIWPRCLLMRFLNLKILTILNIFIMRIILKSLPIRDNRATLLKFPMLKIKSIGIIEVISITSQVVTYLCAIAYMIRD